MLEFTTFSFSIRAESDAHIGDGQTVPLCRERPNHVLPSSASEEKETPSRGNVSTVVRGGEGEFPVLPASSIKGALKAWHSNNEEGNDLVSLFGKIKQGADGEMGRFSFETAQMIPDTKQVSVDLPYWDCDRQTWVATHVAISRESGSADPKRLYFVEMIPAETRFQIDGIWYGREEEARRFLNRLLSPFVSHEGLQIGSGARHGQGRFRASSREVRLSRTWYDPVSGEVKSEVSPKQLVIDEPVLPQQTVLEFVCPGPFQSSDPSRANGDNSDTNTIRALKRSYDVPLLQPTSVAGALRTRAAWISTTNEWGSDDPFKKPSEWSKPSDLTPVERLCGISGWKGRLRLQVNNLTGERSEDPLTSIGIDRFSGAVLDSTLFQFEYFHNVVFSLVLHLEPRGAHERDNDLYQKLLSSLHEYGLKLGHATNRGFGCFVSNIEGGNGGSTE